jgi:hypothetical protein
MKGAHRAMNKSKYDEKSIYMIFACGVPFEDEQMHKVSWVEDEKEARAIFESQYNYCSDAVSWGCDWGSEFDQNSSNPGRFVFLVAQLRVPEIWKTLMEEGEGDISLPNAHMHDVYEELSRCLIYAEAVTATHDYYPDQMSPLMAVGEAILRVRRHCFFPRVEMPVLESTKE